MERNDFMWYNGISSSENTYNAKKSLYIRLCDGIILLWSACEKPLENDIKQQKHENTYIKNTKFCAQNWKENTSDIICINDVKFTIYMWAKIAWKHEVYNEKSHIRPLKIKWSKLFQNTKESSYFVHQDLLSAMDGNSLLRRKKCNFQRTSEL